MLGRILSRSQIVKRCIALLLLLGLPLGTAQAAKENDPTKVGYLELRPALVGNYGEGARPKFFKADVALRVVGTQNLERLEHHQPLIRNELIMLFAELGNDSMTTVEDKEALRQQALARVRKVIEQEEGRPLVEDLLFNNLIAQP
jgi:flagellar FliL protein